MSNVKSIHISNYGDLESVILKHCEGKSIRETNEVYEPMLSALRKARYRAYEITHDANSMDTWYINWWFGQAAYNAKEDDDKQMYLTIWHEVSEFLEEHKTEPKEYS